MSILLIVQLGGAEYSIPDPSHPLHGTWNLGVFPAYGWQSFKNISGRVVFLQIPQAWLLCTGNVEELKPLINGSLAAVAFPFFSTVQPKYEVYPLPPARPVGCAWERMIARCALAGCRGFVRLLNAPLDVGANTGLSNSLWNSATRNHSFLTGKAYDFPVMAWDIGSLWSKYIPGNPIFNVTANPLPPTEAFFTFQMDHFRWIGLTAGTTFMVVFSVWCLMLVVLGSVSLYRHIRSNKTVPYLAVLVISLDIFICICRFTLVVYDPFLLGRYPVWISNVAGSSGMSFAAVTSFIVAIWWLQFSFVIAGKSININRRVFRVVLLTFCIVFCVGIVITEFGVGFYYAFNTDGAQGNSCIFFFFLFLFFFSFSAHCTIISQRLIVTKNCSSICGAACVWNFLPL